MEDLKINKETNEERKLRKAKEKSDRHERRRSVTFRKKNLDLICLKLFVPKIKTFWKIETANALFRMYLGGTAPKNFF